MNDTKDFKIYLAVPSYNNMLELKAFESILFAGRQGVVGFKSIGGSLLSYVFNQLWCDALNQRKKGITHFLMLHADVIPQDTKNWINILKAEMVEHDADVMSVVVPIKSPQGMTSTALDKGCDENPWATKRYSMTEIMEMPETFTSPDLLINTGCFLADITKSWAENIHFEVNDKIIKKPDGDFLAWVEPEDWNFSKQIKGYGGKIYATRKVEVAHLGRADYYNAEAWGQEKDDPVWRSTQ
jgi:hypothetical protein